MTTTSTERQQAHRQRMYNAGYHYVRGQLVKTPPKGPPDHGTTARYRSRRYTCRCDQCRAAQSAYMRNYRAQHRNST